MTITLPPDLEKLVADKVRAGNYDSAEEVVSEALHLLQHLDQKQPGRREELRWLVAQGLQDIDQGRVQPGEQVFAEIKELSRARRAKS